MEETTLLKNCRIIGKDSISELSDIRICNGKIAEIGHFDDESGYDVNGNYVSPGFVDIHTHGGNGSDFMDATTEAFDQVLKYHLEHGTTDVVATSLTASQKEIETFLAEVRSYQKRPQKYAQLLGAHLEGPFLSRRGCGAQNPNYLLDPEKDDYIFITDQSDIIRNVTIAPELDTNGRMTKVLSEHGITVSGGHDDGAYPEFLPAIEAGLRHLTHIYCAMSGFGTKEGVRQIGLREYGLWREELTCEIIADNVHITPEMAKFILKCKGADHVACVSDSLRCAGMPEDDTIYTLGSNQDEASLKVKVANGIAVLADGSKFAGSITSVYEMVRNLIKAGVPVPQAFQMGTSTPAKIIKETEIGSVQVGYRANLCVLDKEFQLVAVYVSGKKVVDKGENRI